MVPKKQVANVEVGVVGKTCGETFGLVRFHGAGAGCGVRVRVRVRFTCGQDFARTAGSAINYQRCDESTKYDIHLSFSALSSRLTHRKHLIQRALDSFDPGEPF